MQDKKKPAAKALKKTTKAKAESKKTTAKKTAAKRSTPKRARFIEEMASPKTKSGTEAAVKAGVAKKNARQTAHRWLTNVDVLEAIENRKKELAEFANVTNEQIIGAAARVAFASIDDCYDESGYFSIEKARATGAIHQVKSISRTPNKYGEAVKVEMYAADEARRELADYLGLKQLPRENEARLKRTIKAIEDYLERFPEANHRHVIETFARGRNVSLDALIEHFEKPIG